jgi:hypothetical protein
MAETNGNGHGRAGLLAGVSERLIRALPPAFLVLTILNIAFIGMAAYVFGHNADQRNALLTKIVESCLTQPRADR